MRILSGLVVAACLLSTRVSAGEEPPPSVSGPLIDPVADALAGPPGRAVEAAPPAPEQTATPAGPEASRAAEVPLDPEAPLTSAPETTAAPETTRAAESAADVPFSSPSEVPAPWPDGRDLEAETDVTLDTSSRVGGGLAFGGPIGAAASVQLLHGLSADVRDDETRVNAVCAVPIPHCAQGFLVRVDAGTGGGKVSLGLGARARVDEEDFRGTVGLGLRASLVRTWGSPLGTEPGLTYLGPELDLSVMKVDLTLGVLWRVGGRAGASALFSWAVGFGL